MNFNKNNDSVSLCFANFNQDFSSLVVGRKSDYSIHSLARVHELLPTLYKFDSKDVVLIERLFSSSLVAFVTSDLPAKLVVHHFKKETEVCTYSYNTKILAIKINKSRLVICLDDSLIIHSLLDLRTLHTIKDIPLYTHRTLSLSPHHAPSLLAYPSNNHSGGVVVFDAENLRAIWTIEAHDSILSAMAFSQDGQLLATASTKGTVIRVFSIATKAKIYEFRRGMKRFATVYSLAFSKDSTFLACSSSTETVHVFKLDPARQLLAIPSSPVAPVASQAASCASGSYQEQGWMDYLGQAIRTSTSYLPSQVSEVLNQDRYFAVAKLPLCGSRNICGLICINNQLFLMVVLRDGILMVYNVDCAQGGECMLVAEHNLSSPSKQVTRTESNLSEDDQPEKPDDSKSREQSPQQPQQPQLQQPQSQPTQQQQRKQQVNHDKKRDKKSTQQSNHEPQLLQQPQPPLSLPQLPQQPQPQCVVTSTDSTGFLKVVGVSASSLEPQWSPLRKSYASVLVDNNVGGCGGVVGGGCGDVVGGDDGVVSGGVVGGSVASSCEFVGDGSFGDGAEGCGVNNKNEMKTEKDNKNDDSRNDMVDEDGDDKDCLRRKGGVHEGSFESEHVSCGVNSDLNFKTSFDDEINSKCHVKGDVNEEDRMMSRDALMNNDKAINTGNKNNKNNKKKKMNRTGTGGSTPPSSSSLSSSLKGDGGGEKIGENRGGGDGDKVKVVAATQKEGSTKEVNKKQDKEAIKSRNKEQENAKEHSKQEKQTKPQQHTKQPQQQSKQQLQQAKQQPLKQQQQQKTKKHKQQQQQQSLKSEGELTLQDAVLSIEDLYLDAECGWLDDSVEFPAIFTNT